MANKTTYVVPQRRKREGKTDYRKRLKLLGSRKIRLVIRITNTHVITQLVEYQATGDKVIVEANSAHLKSFGWKVANANIPEAYLTGMLLAKKAQAANVKEAIIDTGLATSHAGSCVFAAVKGAIDGGLKVPATQSAFPSEERLKGNHIAQYAQTLQKEDKDAYAKRYARYIAQKVDPTKISELSQTVQKAIQG